MKAKVTVNLKDGVLDPQGKAILNASHNLGFDAIQNVTQGKVFEIELAANSENEAKETLASLSEKLLSNPVIENFEIKVL